jgi:ssDNA-binding protein
MADKEKFIPNIINFSDARLSFTHLHKAVARTGKDGKPKPGAKEKFSCEILLDPSRVDHQATILEIKKEAFRALVHRFGPDKATWPKNTGGADLYYCFGLGNDLPKLGRKIYDGYADHFYVKLSDSSRPSLRNRAGTVVVEGDPEVPYGGCYVNGKTTFYSYDNDSKGVNANLRSLQFVRDGKGFGGSAQGAEDEYAALAGDKPKGVQETEVDPFA